MQKRSKPAGLKLDAPGTWAVGTSPRLKDARSGPEGRLKFQHPVLIRWNRITFDTFHSAAPADTVREVRSVPYASSRQFDRCVGTVCRSAYPDQHGSGAARRGKKGNHSTCSGVPGTREAHAREWSGQAGDCDSGKWER